MMRGAGRRWSARAAVVGVAVVAATLGLVVPAWAHVKVTGVEATQGGEGVITFTVPSESDTASTTGLLITFPGDTPFTGVDVQPKAGWTATVSRKPLAQPATADDGSRITQYVSQVDFKAANAAAGIPPGQFDQFNLSVGPFPKQPSVSFAALQTYSDGSTVNWNEKSAAGGAEPAHPAPVLQLAADTAGPAATAAADAPPAAAPPSGQSWTGVTGLAVGIVALLVSVAALVVSRRRVPASPPRE